MDASIRYLAVLSDDPDRLSRFYTTYFGLRELGRSAEGDVSVTDGYFNVSFLKRRPGLGETDGAVGLHHFGVAVNDLRELEGRLEEWSPAIELTAESGDLHHGQYRMLDPNGLPISISTTGFGVQPSPRGFPALRHAAIKIHNPDEILNCYATIFGFREVASSIDVRERGGAARYLGDGVTNLAILGAGNLAKDADAPGAIAKVGLNHFGFLVPNMEEFAATLPAESQTSKRPATRTMAEFRTFDPDGNGIDLSTRAGWEVDFNRWERVENAGS